MKPGGANSKWEPGICKRPWCRKSSGGIYRVCRKCSSAIWRAANPLKAAYQNLKASATRRGLPFLLTLQEFAGFCERTGYLQLKGRRFNCLAVDRIDPRLGYEIGNIRAITCSENSRRVHMPYLTKKECGDMFEGSDSSAESRPVKDG